MTSKKLPNDCTKTELARTVALHALVWQRQHPVVHADGLREQQPVTRMSLAESAQVVLFAPRYKDVPHPAWSTLVWAVRERAREGEDLLDEVLAPRKWHNYLDRHSPNYAGFVASTTENDSE